MKTEITTFAEDLLDLKEFANRLSSFIEVEQDFVEDSLVIALTSSFGFGKSTFLRMWQNAMEAEEAEEAEEASKGGSSLVVPLNAWKTDYLGNPLYSLVSALHSALSRERKGKAIKVLTEAAKDLGWFFTSATSQALAGLFTSAISQALAGLTTVDLMKATETAKQKRSNREQKNKVLPDEFSRYQAAETALEKLKSAIKQCVSVQSGKVVFLVDELDRCRPDYAISYLETIKHIFNVPGAIFILAADKQQLESSAKVAFGDGLEFEEYFRKFAHREITLPEISDQGYRNLAQHYVELYLDNQSRFSALQMGYPTIEHIHGLIGASKLTPRQVQSVFRILGHLMSANQENRGRISRNYAACSILMATLKISAPEIYGQLGKRTLSLKKAHQFLQELFARTKSSNSADAGWWCAIMLEGNGIDTKPDTIVDEMRDLRMLNSHGQPIDESKERIWKAVPSVSLENSRSLLSQTWANIEQVSRWIQETP